jgi:histidinol-phosphate aminotransferase
MDWSSLVVPEIKKLRAYQPGITEEKLQREYGAMKVYKFSSNETAIEPSDSVQRAMQDTLKKMNRYPDAQALLNGLSAHLGVPCEHLIIGHGSMDVIEALIKTLIAPHNNAVLSRYGYCAYAPLITERGASISIAESDSQFGHQVHGILKQINADTRMILLDSPTNLSGSSINLTELMHLIDALPAHVILVLDEAYVEFMGSSFAAYTAHLPLKYPNVVITRSFSKAYGLSGLRIGYGIAAPALLQFVHRIRPPFPVSRVALAGALAALNDHEHLQHVVTSVDNGKQQLATELKALGVVVIEGNSNSVLADFGNIAHSIYESLLKQGFITRAMHVYGLPNHIRISIGTRHEMTLLMGAITDLLEELS